MRCSALLRLGTVDATTPAPKRAVEGLQFTFSLAHEQNHKKQDQSGKQERRASSRGLNCCGKNGHKSLSERRLTVLRTETIFRASGYIDSAGGVSILLV